MQEANEFTRQLQDAARCLWHCLSEMCCVTPITGVQLSARHDGRAITFLHQLTIGHSEGWLKEVEMHMRSTQGSPAYAAVLAEQAAQIRTYQACAPALCDVARTWVEESPHAAIAAINGDPFEIGRVALTVLRYLHGPGRKVTRQGLIPAAQFERRINDLGGPWHFIMVALATMLVLRVRVVSDIVLGRQQQDGDLHFGLATLALPGLRPRLAQAAGLWSDAIAPRVQVLCALPDTALEPFAIGLMRQQQVAMALHAEVGAATQEMKQTARRAHAEATSLRNRLDHAHRQVEGLQRQLAARAPAPSQEAPSKPAVGADTQIETQLRQVRRELESALARQQEQEGELLMLREFCSLLLEPPPAPAQSPVAQRDVADLRKAKVIVVGGRERLHQRLRRQLPRAVFLHPDRAACPADVFDDADGVIYCVKDCSHALAEAAINLARRHGLRSGYVNHTNPDLVLEAIRDILGAQRASAAPVHAAA